MAKSRDVRSISASAAKLRLLKKLRCTLRYEKHAWQAGATLVAGVDEVGRGSLFGPVVAAAVILDPTYRIRGLRDSKLLPPERREVLEKRILEHAVAWAVAAVDAACIDQINIYHASKLAMRNAVMMLAPAADHLLIDAMRPRLRPATAGDYSRRCAFGIDRGSFHSGQGRAGPHDARLGSRFSRIRPSFEQGLQRAQTPGGVASVRADSAAPAVVCARVAESGAARGLRIHAGGRRGNYRRS